MIKKFVFRKKYNSGKVIYLFIRQSLNLDLYLGSFQMKEGSLNSPGDSAFLV